MVEGMESPEISREIQLFRKGFLITAVIALIVGQLVYSIYGIGYICC